MHIYEAIRRRVRAVIIKDSFAGWQSRTENGWRRVPLSVVRAYLQRCGLHSHEVPAALAWLFGPVAYHPGERRRRALPPVDRSEYDSFDRALHDAFLEDWARYRLAKWLASTLLPANLSWQGLQHEYAKAHPDGLHIPRHLFEEIEQI